MIILSLFDGKSCGRMALEVAGVPVTKYYTSEIDKYASQVSTAIYPDNIKLGDVINWREWDIDWVSIDLLIGGSPCQGFSFAGKQLAFDDPRSKLFFVYVDILNHIKTVNPRVKFMLENVKMKKEFLDVISDTLGIEPIFINSALISAQNRQRYYWCNWFTFLPDDRYIYLKDILDVDGTGWIKNHDKWQSRNDKAMCVDANYFKGVDNHGQRTMIYQTPRGKNKGGLKALNGKTPTLSSTNWEHNNHLVQEKSYRKLTPRECGRLQTVPEHIIDIMLGCGVSNTQLYKMLGNGWTIEVISHLFTLMYLDRILP